jgi:hypothetical protein
MTDPIGSPTYPDRRQVSLASGGGVLAVGLSLREGLMVQEYFAEGVPHYALANTSDGTLEVTLRAWHGKAGAVLLGPWVLEPQSVSRRDVKALQQVTRGGLIALGLDGDAVQGLLRAPGPAPDVSPGFIVATVEGLNGIGDRHAGVVVEQATLEFQSGQETEVAIRFPSSAGTLVVRRHGETSRAPDVEVLSVHAEGGVPVRDSHDGYHVHAAGQGTARVALRMPRAGAPTLAGLWGQVLGAEGQGFAFARGFIVSRLEGHALTP